MSSHVATFRALHANTQPLLLPNAWDAGSARLFEHFGATAIATTSAGVAWSLGYQDSHRLPVEEVLALATRLTRAVKVPVSIDFENGYSDDPEEVARHVVQLAERGVAGINLEDGHDDPELVARKIEAIREALSRAGSDLFINLRTDVVLFGLVAQERQATETVARGNLYANAGADGLFVPGLARPESIQRIASAIPVPLNVMAVPDLAHSAELGRLGVRRLSAGSAIAQALWGHAQGVVGGFLEGADQSRLFDGAMSYGELQALFAKA